LSPISKPPPYVNSLLQGQTADAKAFKSNPRIFNTKVSFASVSLNTEELRPGVPTLRMSGCIYHRISDIIPIPGDAPQFMQCFFHESGGNSDTWGTVSDREIADKIRIEARQFNPFIRSLKQCMNDPERTNIPLYRLVIRYLWQVYHFYNFGNMFI
jgi:hypothetical protein